MHTNSTNQTFKSNLERAIVELLVTELEREPKPLAECRQDAEREIDQNSFLRLTDKRLFELLSRDNPSSALWRLQLDYPKSEEGLRLRERFLAAAALTERPITDEEVFKSYGGTKEYLAGLIAEGRFQDTKMAHYEELPRELVAELVAWTTAAQLQRLTAAAFAPQFKMLLGLCDFIQFTAGNSSQLKAASPVLQAALMQDLFFKAPVVEIGLSKIDLYCSLQLALARLQQGPELREFWLDLLRREDQADRLSVSALGLFGTAPNRQARRELIPQILALAQEKQGLFVEHAYTDGAGFLHTYKPFEALFSQVLHSCFSGTRFYRYDPATPALEVLNGWALNSFGYDLTVSVYTPAGMERQQVRYDLRPGAEQKLGALEAFTTEFLEDGYPLTPRLSVSLFTCRGIAVGQSTLVVDAQGRDLSGAVEGVLGLMGSSTPFLYDPSNGTLLFGSCLDSSFMPALRPGMSRNGFDLSKLPARIPVSDLMPLSEFISKLQVDAAAKRRQGMLFDSTYYLERHLRPEVEARLRIVVPALIAKLSIQEIDPAEHHQPHAEL